MSRPKPYRLQSADIANFPLATVEADKPLPLVAGINPAWQKQIEALREHAIVPLLGKKESLSAAQWTTLSARFEAFEAWQAAEPAGNVEQLGVARLREIAASHHREAIGELIRMDKSVANEVNATHSVERLLRFRRDLYKLVNNFVSFRSFYTGRDKAIFQVGTLYLDSRSCDLCVRVEDIAKHAEFAAMSGLYLAYCDCIRKGGTGKNEHRGRLYRRRFGFSPCGPQRHFLRSQRQRLGCHNRTHRRPSHQHPAGVLGAV